MHSNTDPIPEPIGMTPAFLAGLPAVLADEVVLRRREKYALARRSGTAVFIKVTTQVCDCPLANLRRGPEMPRELA